MLPWELSWLPLASRFMSSRATGDVIRFNAGSAGTDHVAACAGALCALCSPREERK